MRQINEGERNNLEVLRRAFKNDDVALMVVRETATMRERVAICAVGIEDGDAVFTPFALTIDGNPFELLEPPNPDGGYYANT